MGTLPPRPEKGGRTRTLKLNIEPYRQGELDSLCGIYAIINALYALCPEMDGDAAAILFRKLVMALGHHMEPPVGAVYDGMDQPTIESLLHIAEREMHRILEIRIKIKPFPVLAGRCYLASLWDRLRAEIGRRQVAIIGLAGVDDHWTVAYAVTEKIIRLLDSTDRHVLMRSRCTTHQARTRFRLDPSAILLVKRGK